MIFITHLSVSDNSPDSYSKIKEHSSRRKVWGVFYFTIQLIISSYVQISNFFTGFWKQGHLQEYISFMELQLAPLFQLGIYRIFHHKMGTFFQIKYEYKIKKESDVSKYLVWTSWINEKILVDFLRPKYLNYRYVIPFQIHISKIIEIYFLVGISTNMKKGDILRIIFDVKQWHSLNYIY